MFGNHFVLAWSLRTYHFYHPQHSTTEPSKQTKPKAQTPLGGRQTIGFQSRKAGFMFFYHDFIPTEVVELWEEFQSR